MERSNPGSKTKIMPFKDIKKVTDNLQAYSNDAYKKGNMGLAKHFLVQACQIVIKDRHLCTQTDQNKRAQLAQNLINQAKLIKAKIVKQIDFLKSKSPIFKTAHETTFVDPSSIKVKFEDIVG